MSSHEGAERLLDLVVVKLRRRPNGDVTLRPYDGCADFGPVSVGSEKIEHLHTRLQPEELQHLRGLPALVQLDVVRAAMGCVSRCRSDALRRLNSRNDRGGSECKRQCDCGSEAHVGSPLAS